MTIKFERLNLRKISCRKSQIKSVTSISSLHNPKVLIHLFLKDVFIFQAQQKVLDLFHDIFHFAETCLEILSQKGFLKDSLISKYLCCIMPVHSDSRKKKGRK